MKTVKPIIILLSCFMATLSMAQSESNNSKAEKAISQAIKASDAQALSYYFYTNIDLSLPNANGVFSKDQSTQLLKKFFSTNQVSSFKVKHNGSSRKGTFFTIGDIETQNGKFSIYYLMRQKEDKYLIHQFQIQTEN